MDLAVERQHQRRGVLGHRMGRVGRYAHGASPLGQYRSIPRIQMAVMIDDPHAVLRHEPVERLPVIGLRSEKHDFHG